MKRTVTFDDLTGEADATSVSFAVEGITYEVDLTETSLQRLHEALAPFVAVARRTSVRKTAGAPKTATKLRQGRETPEAAHQAKAVREWAADNGIAVPPRGPISSAIIDAYRSADAESHKPAAPKKPTPVDAAKVRRWAALNAINVAPRGPISSTIIEQYRAAQEEKKRPVERYSRRSPEGASTSQAKPKSKARPKSKAKSLSALDARAVREWAASNGIAILPRGPISSTIIDQFKAAHL